MKITQAHEAEWTTVSNHRGGRIEFKTLLIGTEGAPDNYYLSLYKAFADFVAPAHRHNFDQIRIGLSGKLNYGKHKDILPGEIGYFPEGQHYGPQAQEPNSDCVGLVVQFGGASGHGFMSQRQLREGFHALCQVGTFVDGVFRTSGDTPPTGVTKNRDGYEAIWEAVNGRPIEYVQPRYGAPIHLHPHGFAWQEINDDDRVLIKPLGTFTERSIELSQVKLASGAIYEFPLRAGIRLVYALEGEGGCNGRTWTKGTAIEIAADECARFVATRESLLFVHGLPIFASHDVADPAAHREALA
ncbi:hypothetical protein [Paraburkholderia sp.]|uniref:hypothetical protein n=1 Tax=Paraburkholderia sp. TaxID=1926495 RepID=UPI003D6E5FFE